MNTDSAGKSAPSSLRGSAVRKPVVGLIAINGIPLKHAVEATVRRSTLCGKCSYCGEAMKGGTVYYYWGHLGIGDVQLADKRCCLACGTEE
jgi:hypothetical protein